MSDTTFSQGLELLFFGMGTVVIFLVLLIFSVKMMSAVINYFVAAPDSFPARSAGDIKVDPKKIAAIGAAITKFRASKRS